MYQYLVNIVVMELSCGGGEPKKLVDELIDQSGTNKGMGGSPPIFDTKIGMYGHVGLIGDQVPVAAGYSLIMKIKRLFVLAMELQRRLCIGNFWLRKKI